MYNEDDVMSCVGGQKPRVAFARGLGGGSNSGGNNHYDDTTLRGDTMSQVSSKSKLKTAAMSVISTHKKIRMIEEENQRMMDEYQAHHETPQRQKKKVRINPYPNKSMSVRQSQDSLKQIRKPNPS